MEHNRGEGPQSHQIELALSDTVDQRTTIVEKLNNCPMCFTLDELRDEVRADIRVNSIQFYLIVTALTVLRKARPTDGCVKTADSDLFSPHLVNLFRKILCGKRFQVRVTVIC